MWKEITTKNWKKIKEISEKDDKRPPWRMASVSTLPKADKSALLRAKLLDASRRMRAGKNQIGIQTDLIPTKVMKEVPTQIYESLIPLEDKEILTDGTIAIRPDGGKEFLLTHSVAQMTDGIQVSDAATQTATPRISHNFFQAYSEKFSDKSGTELDESLTEGERKLIEQRKALREIDRQLTQNCFRNSNYRSEDEISDDSLSDSTRKFESLKSNGFPKIPKSTLASWHFDFSDDDDPPALPRRVGTEIPTRPWNSFRDMIIGNKLANMKLSPTPVRRASLKKKSVSWGESQHNAVAELVSEANALLNVFDQMSIVLGPDLQLSKLPEKEDTNIQYLSEYWDPILRESERGLDEKVRSLKYTTLKKFKPVEPEYVEDLIHI
ncbi:uncharacterized protein LOC119656550 isoform X2 [Hermetia illucens]|uniref:uncharacterized protein LOC119656550 isoform X2 n=1 Tax=Hermetia illucens TaxID=343691 RepID=UPI0018CC79DC|nr:uncharacterized protein LOC119656550 isoform X2 [Hermetia illucens]